MWISKEKYEAMITANEILSDRMTALDDGLKWLKQFHEDTAAALNARIAELEESYKRGSLKSDEPESVQIDPGHVPFSQRKRNFEATKRQEAASKKKGPQPAKGT